MYIPHQSFVFINTEDEANHYIIPPSTTALLMCRNAPYFFIKTADSLGQYTLDRYEFKKAPRPQDNVVTTEQFNQFKEEIRALLTSHQEVKPNE
jgi:hypothetical protein